MVKGEHHGDKFYIHADGDGAVCAGDREQRAVYLRKNARVGVWSAIYTITVG